MSTKLKYPIGETFTALPLISGNRIRLTIASICPTEDGVEYYAYDSSFNEYHTIPSTFKDDVFYPTAKERSFKAYKIHPRKF